MPNVITVTQRIMPKIYKIGVSPGIQPGINKTPPTKVPNIDKKDIPSDWPWYNPFGFPPAKA